MQKLAFLYNYLSIGKFLGKKCHWGHKNVTGAVPVSLLGQRFIDGINVKLILIYINCNPSFFSSPMFK